MIKRTPAQMQEEIDRLNDLVGKLTQRVKELHGNLNDPIAATLYLKRRLKMDDDVNAAKTVKNYCDITSCSECIVKLTCRDSFITSPNNWEI